MFRRLAIIAATSCVFLAASRAWADPERCLLDLRPQELHQTLHVIGVDPDGLLAIWTFTQSKPQRL